jgi:hypothetical protein
MSAYKKELRADKSEGTDSDSIIATKTIMISGLPFVDKWPHWGMLEVLPVHGK